MDVRLYTFPGSHPCEAVLAAVRHKQIPHRVVLVPPVVHRAVMWLMFRGLTVPAMKADGRKYLGTTKIMHALDELASEHPLYSDDRTRRVAIEEAERWGESWFQDIGRRLVWSHLVRSPATVKGWVSSWPVSPRLRRVLDASAGPIARIAAWANNATDANVRADLANLPRLLDRVDEMIAEGVIGGDQPNAADFQILSSIGQWMNLADLRPLIAGRPCGVAAARLFPVYRGDIPGGILPSAWFEPLATATTRASGERSRR